MGGVVKEHRWVMTGDKVSDENESRREKANEEARWTGYWVTLSAVAIPQKLLCAGVVLH